MNTVSDLTPELQEQLKTYSEAHGISEAEALRQAVEEFLRQRAFEAALNAVFGMWADRGIDGVEYQRKLRAEWDRR